MEPLFATEEDYEAFNKRQSAYQVKKGGLSQYHGNCYLGIDAGSTTTKTALVGEDGTCFTPSTAIITEARLRQPSVLSRRSTAFFRRMHTLHFPVPQATARR